MKEARFSRCGGDGVEGSMYGLHVLQNAFLSIPGWVAARLAMGNSKISSFVEL